MRNSLNMYINEFRQDRQKQIKFALILAALAVVVAGVVFWQLHSTGMAMTNEVFCGQEEHIHSADCYDDGVLVCGIPEHTHTVECLMDETADVETSDEWEATLPQELTGSWSDDVAAVAVSQIGYTESERNFILSEDGETRRGYTRYGAWYGNDYGDWDAMFVSFCLNYAGVPEDEVPESSGAYALAVAYADLGLYADNGNIEPRQGDIVFFDADEDGQADSVGILTDVNDDTLTVVEGNLDDAVTETEYQADDVQIIGYGILPDQPGMENEGESEETGETVAVSGSAENDPEAAGSSSGTEDNQIKPLRDDDSVAFAVYSEYDSSLTFYADEEVPETGTIYGDENKTVTAVYTGFDSPNYSDRYTADSPAPWYDYASDILTVYTDESFAGVDLYYLNYWFYNLDNCKIVDFTYINTGNVISIQGTFQGCYALTEIVGIGDLDTSSVERLYSTFQNCESLKELPISGWDVSSCQSMDRTFYDCKLVETFDLSGWNTSNVTDMAYIFQNCESATTIDVSDWNVEKVTDFTGAFRRCYKMTDIDLSGWVTTSATKMSYMFRQDTVLEKLNIVNFNTTKVIEYGDFLTSSPALKEITIGDYFDLFTKSETAALTDIQIWYDGTGAVVSDNYLIGVSGAGTYYTYMIASSAQVVLNLGNGNGKYNNADYTHDRQAGTLLRYTTVSLAEYADSNGYVTINLPSDADLDSTFTVVDAAGDLEDVKVDLGKDLAYDYKLVGWVNVATGDYYDVSNGAAEAEVEVGGDIYNVFYADWIAATYDHGSQTDTGLRDDIVSTSGFVTIHMYDYNDLFNLYSESLEQNNEDGVIWEAWTDSGELYNRILGANYGGNKLTESFIFVNNGTVGYSSTQGEQSTGGMLTWPNNKTNGNTWTGTGKAPRDATAIWGITSPYSAPMNMLFDPESSAVGVHYVGEADYLFWIDGNGYYTYNSKEAAATYNQSDECFYVYKGTQSVTNTEFSCFLPYNTYGESLNAVNGTVNYFFGMDMEVDFYLPNATGTKGGNTVNGEDMVFNFSGDDDILIFVDDELVLDMSGIHDEAFGSINFNEGTVKMAMSEEDLKTAEGTSLSLESGNHDLKVYYMERGGYASNLEIQFNVVSVWEYESGEVQTVTADKTWVDSNGEVIKDPTTISDVYSSVEVGLFDALGPLEEKTEDTDGVFGYTKNGTQYTVTYEDDSGISHTFVYDSSVPSLTYTEDDGSPVTYKETNSAGQVLDENGYVIAWLEGETLHIRVDQRTLNSENNWHYAWELLDPDGEYEVQELSESSSYTTTSERENLLRYEYWSIIGDSQIEYSFETGETLQVILTEAAQEASNTLGDTKDAMGWVIVATENGITTKQVEFSQIAELQELIDDNEQTYYKTISGVTSQSEIDKLGSGAIWYVVDAEVQTGDIIGNELEDFYLYCILDGTNYYLTLNGTTLSVTNDANAAGVFCYDSLGELLVVLDDGSTARVEIQADGTITIGAAETVAELDDIRIFTLQETETSGFSFTASNTFLPDFTLKKVSAMDSDITLAGVKFTLQDEEGQYYEYDEETDEVTWSSENSENKEITIDDDGTYIFHHLPDGTYTLTETETVDGYNMLPSAIKITIDGGVITDASWSSEVNGSTVPGDNYVVISDDGLTITVKNHTSAVLPNAGGSGTTLFYIVGGVLAAGAAGVLIRRRRING